MSETKEQAIARGLRLKHLRQIAGLTRDQMAEKTNFSKASISYWENATFSGLTNKGAEKIIDVLNAYGVECDLSWLMYGHGSSPNLIATSKEFQTKPSNKFENANRPTVSTNKEYLEQEIELFRSSDAQTIIAVLNDMSMHPAFDKGDFVGGIWQSSDILLVERDCIVKIDDQIQVRRVKRNTKGKFDLIYLTYDPSIEKPYQIKNIPLLEIAPIIRVWRTS